MEGEIDSCIYIFISINEFWQKNLFDEFIQKMEVVR